MWWITVPLVMFSLYASSSELNGLFCFALFRSSTNTLKQLLSLSLRLNRPREFPKNCSSSFMFCELGFLSLIMVIFWCMTAMLLLYFLRYISFSRKVYISVEFNSSLLTLNQQSGGDCYV